MSKLLDEYNKSHAFHASVIRRNLSGLFDDNDVGLSYGESFDRKAVKEAQQQAHVGSIDDFDLYTDDEDAKPQIRAARRKSGALERIFFKNASSVDEGSSTLEDRSSDINPPLEHQSNRKKIINSNGRTNEENLSRSEHSVNSISKELKTAHHRKEESSERNSLQKESPSGKPPIFSTRQDHAKESPYQDGRKIVEHELPAGNRPRGGNMLSPSSAHSPVKTVRSATRKVASLYTRARKIAQPRSQVNASNQPGHSFSSDHDVQGESDIDEHCSLHSGGVRRKTPDQDSERERDKATVASRAASTRSPRREDTRRSSDPLLNSRHRTQTEESPFRHQRPRISTAEKAETEKHSSAQKLPLHSPRTNSQHGKEDLDDMARSRHSEKEIQKHGTKSGTDGRNRRSRSSHRRRDESCHRKGLTSGSLNRSDSHEKPNDITHEKHEGRRSRSQSETIKRRSRRCEPTEERNRLLSRSNSRADPSDEEEHAQALTPRDKRRQCSNARRRVGEKPHHKSERSREKKSSSYSSTIRADEDDGHLHRTSRSRSHGSPGRAEVKTRGSPERRRPLSVVRGKQAADLGERNGPSRHDKAGNSSTSPDGWQGPPPRHTRRHEERASRWSPHGRRNGRSYRHSSSRSLGHSFERRRSPINSTNTTIQSAEQPSKDRQSRRSASPVAQENKPNHDKGTQRASGYTDLLPRSDQQTEAKHLE